MVLSLLMRELEPGGSKHALVERGLLTPGGELRDLDAELTLARDAIREVMFGIFRGLTGMQPGFNWAVYNLQPKFAPGYELDEDMEREILLVIDTRDPELTPSIRILTNEGFDVDDHTQYLIDDFTLDFEDDADYFINTAVELDNGKLSDDVPLFVVDDGELVVENFADFTASYGLSETVWHRRRRQTVKAAANPFGLIEDQFDQLDALAAAQAILAEITTSLTTPACFGVQQNLG